MATRLSKVLALALLLSSGAVHAQRYPYFGPANGILVGSTTTWQTSPAVWSNIQSLLTGTCDSSHAVYGDGSCQTPAAGTITGITWAVPSGFSISGSPCTSGSCSFTLSTSLSGVLKGTGSGFTTAAATDITTLLNPTAHGVLFGEGTSAFTSLTMAADTLLQGQGTGTDPAAVSVPNCGSSSTALNYSTSTHAFGCQTLTTGGSPGGALGDMQYYGAGGIFSGASDFVYNTGGTVVGSATGGQKGAGTINAAGLYVNGVAATVGCPAGSANQLQYYSSGSCAGAPFTYQSAVNGGTLYQGSPTAPASGTSLGGINVAGYYWVNGTPTAIFGELNNNGTACTVINANNGIINCTRNSVGDLTVAFATANANYVCTASAISGTAFVVVIYARTTSSVSIRTYTTGGTLTDVNDSITCD